MDHAQARAVGVAISPVATGIICIAASFLLGAFYNHWAIDYNIIWLPYTTKESIASSLAHYTQVVNAPTWYAATLAGITVVASVAAGTKVALNGRGGILFDGASLLLLCSAALTYLTAIPAAYAVLGAHASSPRSTEVLEALRSLASSHMLIAVFLTGLLSFQGGQYFSDKPREDE